MTLFIGMLFKPKQINVSWLSVPFFNNSKIIFMTTNLLQTLQKNLGFAELKKVDPNTQEIKANTTFDEDKLNQAATSAVMAGLYKYSRCNEGSEQILCADITKNWLETIFGDSTKEAITKVANYAHISNEKAMQKMEMIARESVKVIRDKNLLVVND